MVGTGGLVVGTGGLEVGKNNKHLKLLLYTSTIHFQSFRGSGCSIPKLWRFMSMRFTYLDSKIQEIPQDR